MYNRYLIDLSYSWQAMKNMRYTSQLIEVFKHEDVILLRKFKFSLTLKDIIDCEI